MRVGDQRKYMIKAGFWAATTQISIIGQTFSRTMLRAKQFHDHWSLNHLATENQNSLWLGWKACPSVNWKQVQGLSAITSTSWRASSASRWIRWSLYRTNKTSRLVTTYTWGRLAGYMRWIPKRRLLGASSGKPVEDLQPHTCTNNARCWNTCAARIVHQSGYECGLK